MGIWSAAGCYQQFVRGAPPDTAPHITRVRGKRVVHVAFCPGTDVVVVAQWDGTIQWFGAVRRRAGGRRWDGRPRLIPV